MQPLRSIPPGSNVFIDANIFVYGLSNVSKECYSLLERCSNEELTGISLFEIVNEATHKFMLAEAKSKGLNPATVATLRKHFAMIPGLRDYWEETLRILALNLLLLSTQLTIVTNAQAERRNGSLLTNDSMIVSCMREYGINCLATANSDFERANGIMVFGPSGI